MLTKLEALIKEKESNIVVLQYGLKTKQELHLVNNTNIMATVTYNKIEQVYKIIIEQYNSYSEEYTLVECKYYNTVNEAFSYIEKMLQ